MCIGGQRACLTVLDSSASGPETAGKGADEKAFVAEKLNLMGRARRVWKGQGQAQNLNCSTPSLGICEEDLFSATAGRARWPSFVVWTALF